MLERINARLKEDGVPVRVELRCRKYNLRANLPTRDGLGKRQQRLSLDVTNLQAADRKARELGQQLKLDTFSWTVWDTRTEITTLTCGDFRAAGRRLYETKYDTETAWQKKWRPALNKLPADSVPCSDVLLTAVVASLKPNSAARRDQGNVLSQIAYSLTLDGAAIQNAARGYSTKELTERDIPEDDLIERHYFSLRSPTWKWMFGMCATYGLRGHEIIGASIDGSGNCHITDDTKTGYHVAWPCHERWLDEFNLRRVSRPSQSVEEVTNRAASYYRRFTEIDFPLYALRHAYAIRLFKAQVPIDISARLMGHSAQVHRTTYMRWFNRAEIVQLRSSFQL